MIQVFRDAKRSNLTAFPWPARYVSSVASHEFDPHSKSSDIITEKILLQYDNPAGHLKIIETIIQSHQHHHKFMRRFQQCWAISLPIDGSVHNLIKFTSWQKLSIWVDRQSCCLVCHVLSSSLCDGVPCWNT